MRLITQADYELLMAKDDTTLVQWYCKLNAWEWPDEIPDEDTVVTSNGRRSRLCCLIEAIVGKRACADARYDWERMDISTLPARERLERLSRATATEA